MKNKKTLYFLIPLVALIWGIVIWKAFAYKPSSTAEVIPHYSMAVQEELDTLRYEVIANYRDPFLRSSSGRAPKTVSQAKKRENNMKKVKVNSVHGTPRPEGLVYHGLIDGRQDRVGLLELGSSRLLVEEDSMVKEYRILSVEPDTLRISYQEKVFAYGKQ